MSLHAFSLSLTTTAFNHSSIRWFETSFRKPIPRGHTLIFCTASNYKDTSKYLTISIVRSWHTVSPYFTPYFNKIVSPEDLMTTAEAYANMMLKNSQQAIRSAKETILEVIGRSLDDALRLETINGYSSVGDFSEVKERLAKFYNQ